MQSSTTMGMQTLDDHMLQLIEAGKVDRATVIKYSHELERFLPKGSVGKDRRKKEMTGSLKLWRYRSQRSSWESLVAP